VVLHTTDISKIKFARQFPVSIRTLNSNENLGVVLDVKNSDRQIHKHRTGPETYGRLGQANNWGLRSG